VRISRQTEYVCYVLNLWLAFVLVGFQMGAQALDDLIVFAFVEFFLNFFQREVNDVVMV
jgi:hypothetical protein